MNLSWIRFIWLNRKERLAGKGWQTEVWPDNSTSNARTVFLLVSLASIFFQFGQIYVPTTFDSQNVIIGCRTNTPIDLFRVFWASPLHINLCIVDIFPGRNTLSTSQRTLFYQQNHLASREGATKSVVRDWVASTVDKRGARVLREEKLLLQSIASTSASYYSYVKTRSMTRKMGPPDTRKRCFIF